jgi:hypothetical protein
MTQFFTDTEFRERQVYSTKLYERSFRSPWVGLTDPWLQSVTCYFNVTKEPDSVNAAVWNVMVATCPSRTSLARIANQWTAMSGIAHGGGPVRFSELRQAVDGISGRSLSRKARSGV